MLVSESVQNAIKVAERIEVLCRPMIQMQTQINRVSRIANNDRLAALARRNAKILKVFEMSNTIGQSARLLKVPEPIRWSSRPPSLTRDDLYERISIAVDSSLPYLPVKDQQQVREAIATELVPGPKKRLTLEQLYMLFSLLLMILPILLSYNPDPQSERSIELQERSIELQEELISVVSQYQESSDKRFDDLQNAIDTMCEAIYVVGDEIDLLKEEDNVLRDQISQVDDFADSDIQGENSQALEHNDEP